MSFKYQKILLLNLIGSGFENSLIATPIAFEKLLLRFSSFNIRQCQESTKLKLDKNEIEI